MDSNSEVNYCPEVDPETSWNEIPFRDRVRVLRSFHYFET